MMQATKTQLEHYMMDVGRENATPAGLDAWAAAREPAREPQLALFTNGMETIAAYSAEDAKAISAETVGEDLEYIDDFWVLEPYGELVVTYDDALYDLREKMPFLPRHGTVQVVARHIDWVEANGRGIVCSTEW